MAGGTHTFLFTDLVGFTALAASEGDDHAADVALEFALCVEPLAGSHGAEVVKRLGDGLMLRCPDPERGGAPRAARSSPSRTSACPCASGCTPAPRSSARGDWYGTTVNVAARLCAAAGGGEVLVSETTRERAGRLRKLEVGDHRLHWLKNLSEPVGARTVAVPEPRGRFAFADQALGFLCPLTPDERGPVTQPALPPGPRLPRAAQTLAWVTRPLPWLTRCRERYGDSFTVRIAQEGDWVMLTDPERRQAGVHRATPAAARRRGQRDPAGRCWATTRCCCSTRSATCRQRKLLLPPFHGERMRALRRPDGRGRARRRSRRWPRGEPFALWPRMQAVTLEVIIRAVFGVQGERAPRAHAPARCGRLLELATDIKTFLAIATLGPRRLAGMRVLPARARRGRTRWCSRRSATAAAAADLEEREDILSLLLQARHEDGSPMSDEELRDELMTLLVAGHETTATALAWAVERLVRHPDKLAAAGRRGRGRRGRVPDAVIKETLRLRPVIPMVVRKLPGADGDRRHAAARGRARDAVHPTSCTAARTSTPTRTASGPSASSSSRPGTYTWIPFGGGVRRCLGASFALFEMKMVLQRGRRAGWR